LDQKHRCETTTTDLIGDVPLCLGNAHLGQFFRKPAVVKPPFLEFGLEQPLNPLFQLMIFSHMQPPNAMVHLLPNSAKPCIVQAAITITIALGMILHIVLTAVDFDNETMLQAREVDDMTTFRILAAKMKSTATP
jgi:hypothetical protein